MYKSDKRKMIYNRYKNALARMKEYFKVMSVQKISQGDYQKFLNWYDQGKAKATVQKLNTHIRASVKDAIDDGYIPIDFTRKVEITATKKDSEKHCNFEESVDLYNELFNRLNRTTDTHHLLLMGLIGGLRYGELVGLTPDCFNYQKTKFIFIVHGTIKKILALSI